MLQRGHVVRVGTSETERKRRGSEGKRVEVVGVGTRQLGGQFIPRRGKDNA